jgi:GT2 family glycosyltransferase
MISFVSGSAKRPHAGDAATLIARGQSSAAWQAAMLWLRVQSDAFRFDPLGYLQAVLWRARGLRVRSRNRIAGLAGRSRWAYPFWIARREPQIRCAGEDELATDLPTIRTIIDCSGGTEFLGETLASLPAGAEPILVGGRAIAEAAQIRSIDELAGNVREAEFWLCPIRCGDRLAAGALQIYAATLARAKDASAVYSDDDLLDENGVRVHPHFKPDWNPELFEHHDFITGASIVKASREQLARLPRKGWATALVNEAVSRGPAPIHLPLVLHHRRNRPQPVVPAKPAEIELARQWPLVTVIIPTRNRADLLRKCMEGLRETRHVRTEVIVVDNESDDREAVTFLEELKASGVQVIRVSGEFNFSRLNNVAVTHATGDLLCFVNNDVEMPDPDWLSLLVRQALRPDIGAVGARLLYPDGTVQHAGVFTGIGGGAAHAHRFVGKDDGGYFERARLPQRVSAVTGACLAVSREKFLEVGGFDEDNFPVAFNDVDLCLKLNQRGWQSFYEPRATLIHHESKSRGSDRHKANRARFAEELAALKRKWQTDERRDPFHHPQLSPFCEQFLIAV